MQLDLGNKIRDLRRRDGRTQEALAQASVLYTAGGVRYGECHLVDEDGYSVYDTAKHTNYEEWQEAIPLYEKALEGLPVGKLRDRAVEELSQLYLNMGEHEKGMALVDRAGSRQGQSGDAARPPLVGMG